MSLPTIKSLAHFTISALDIEANIIFYSKILGLTHGESLDGGEPGAYFYLKNTLIPVVHIVDQNKINYDKKKDFKLDAKTLINKPNYLTTGALDHIAFSLNKEDFETIQSRFADNNIVYKIGCDLMPIMKQIWSLDPNGIKIELNFS